MPLRLGMFPRSRPRESHRRAHRLQSRLRLPDRDSSGLLRGSAAPSQAANSACIRRILMNCESGRSKHCDSSPTAEALERLRHRCREGIIELGKRIQPLDLAIYSTVPVGSGLSSSASIEVSSALALLFGRGHRQDRTREACQRAEREFVGVPCGIMDQYVSVFGEENRAIKIDCRSLTHETAQLPRRRRSS